jgi:tetratricopeptide (TPR) repeat protein
VIAWRLSKGDEELARKHLELHVLIDARDYDVHMKLGTLRLKAGDAEGAYASAEGALEVAGVRAEEAQKRADARALGAEAAFALGRVAEARAKIGAALSEVPDHARSLELKDKLPPASPEGGAEDSKEDRR